MGFLQFTIKLIIICNIIHGKIFLCTAHPPERESCETFPTEIHLTKEEYDDSGRLYRSCSGEVNVNRCEGKCKSQVQPSVVSPTGFSKECSCCREDHLREKIVILTHCYDPDGIRFEDGEKASLEVQIQEPAECHCSKCGDYTR